MQLHGKPILWHVQEQWAGTATFSAVAFNAELSVGFPVDYRTGWDLSRPQHREFIDTSDKLFKPLLKVSAPDCRYWCCAGNTIDTDLKARMRKAQTAAKAPRCGISGGSR